MTHIATALPSLGLPSAPLPAVRARTQGLIGRLQLLAHFSMQLNVLLLPLLVLQLTDSIALTGAALLIAWTPKLALFVSGGSVVQRFSAARMHIVLEALRMLALAVLLATVVFRGPFLLIAIATAVYQCAGAIWAILFERLVSAWWPESDRAQGHARMLQQFHFGSVAALCLGLLVQSPLILLWIAFAVQLFTILFTVRLRHGLFAIGDFESATTGPRSTLLRQLRTDLKAARHWILIRASLVGFMTALPYALLYAGAVFYLDRASPGAASSAAWPSALMLIRTFAGLLTVLCIARVLQRTHHVKLITTTGMALVFIGCAALSVGTHPWMLVVASIALSVSAYGCAPLVRTWRQRLIGEHVPAASRSGVTGMMAATEITSNVGAAFLLMVAGQALPALSALAGVLGIAGLLGLRRLMAPRSEEKRNALSDRDRRPYKENGP